MPRAARSAETTVGAAAAGGARGGGAWWREGAKRMTPLGSAQLERSRQPPEDTN